MSTKIAEIQEDKQAADSDADRKSPEKASVGAHKPRVAPTKAKSAKKATPAKKGRNAPKPAKLAKSVAGAGEGSKTARVAPSKAQLARKATGTKKAAAPARRGSKTAKILDLLKRPGGVTLKELMKATGWQPHSVRGFLSGTIGKKRGIPVESFQSSDTERAYRVASK
jgi:hypothetical protein